jgi:hypothetical protein
VAKLALVIGMSISYAASTHSAFASKDPCSMVMAMLFARRKHAPTGRNESKLGSKELCYGHAKASLVSRSIRFVLLA